MKRLERQWLVGVVGLALSAAAMAEDRLSLSANGLTQTDTNGGGGGAIAWLHNFNPSLLAGVGAEYQRLADAHWQFGSINGAWTGGEAGKKWSLYAEAHEGNGQEALRRFDYRVEAVGALLPLYRRLSLQLEDKEINVDTTHGNLPKAGLSLLWTARLQTAVAYAHSVSGNLGTDLTTVRLDYYGPSVHFILGGASGPASTVLLGSPSTGFTTAFLSPSTREGYIGMSHPYKRAEFLALGDYMDIGGSKRLTLTLNCMLHFNQPQKVQ